MRKFLAVCVLFLLIPSLSSAIDRKPADKQSIWQDDSFIKTAQALFARSGIATSPSDKKPPLDLTPKVQAFSAAGKIEIWVYDFDTHQQLEEGVGNLQEFYKRPYRTAADYMVNGNMLAFVVYPSDPKTRIAAIRLVQAFSPE